MKSILLAVLFCLVSVLSARAELRAGAAKVDVTPPVLPVIRNGGFLEATDNKVNDPLHARCLVLDDRVTRLAVEGFVSRVKCSACLGRVLVL